jgi:hypothetical protein
LAISRQPIENQGPRDSQKLAVGVGFAERLLAVIEIPKVSIRACRPSDVGSNSSSVLVRHRFTDSGARASRKRRAMKARLPEAQIAKTAIQQIDVGEVKVGPIASQLRSIVVMINLHFSLDWKVSVTIDAPFDDVDFSRSGSLSLGILDFELGLGDITLPDSEIFLSTLTLWRLRMWQRS